MMDRTATRAWRGYSRQSMPG